jgi:fructose-1,6-bisphosphatase/inositol monophosphatase family enzyme
MVKLRKLRGVPKPTIAALSVAVRAADRAGEIIREGYYQALEIKDKGHGDLVSQVDIKCDHVISEAIYASYPDDIIVSEELSPNVDPNHTKYWVVDPLDGTSAYLFRTSPDMPSVLIAYCDEQGAQFSVVYFPLTDEFFYAVRGHGAYENRRRLECKNYKLNESWVEMNQYSEAVYESDVFKAMRNGLRSKGGAKLVTTCPPHSGVGVRIPQGEKKVAAVVHDNNGRWLKQGPWDIIPVALIVTEAGGAVINFKGKTYDPFSPEPFIVASSNKLAMDIVKLAKKTAS